MAAPRACSLVVLTFGLAAAGCSGCRERVELINRTPNPLWCRLALPYPGYALNVGRACQFEFMLQPGSTWRSWLAADDETELPMRCPNGPAVLRVMQPGCAWTTYDFDVHESATIAISRDEGDPCSSTILVVQTNEDERELPSTAMEWFKD